MPALRELVANKGSIIRNGKPATPERDRNRLYAAKVAIARLDGKNGVVRLAEMLDDPTLERNHRYEVILRLGRQPDPRAIPYLVKVIKTDTDHYIIGLAIGALTQLKYRAAVEGLIECFDVDLKSQGLGKGERVTPATYRNLIAQQPAGDHRPTFWRRQTAVASLVERKGQELGAEVIAEPRCRLSTPGRPPAGPSSTGPPHYGACALISRRAERFFPSPRRSPVGPAELPGPTRELYKRHIGINTTYRIQ